MTDKEQNKEQNKAAGMDSGKSSRVSKAAGSLGSQQVQVEQRASPSRSHSQRSSRSSNAGKPAPKKRAAPNTPAGRKRSYLATPQPADSRLIQQVRDSWGNMQPHEQQRLFSIFFLVLAIILFGALTIWHSLPFFNPLANFFFSLFGWAAFPLALGLIALACAHFMEGLRNIRFISWSLVLGLSSLLILLLIESQLLFGHITGGILGSALATPMLNWGFGAHILILGLFVIITLLTFRITMSQFQAVLRSLQKIFVEPRDTQSEPGRSTGVSPFLGQRPRFSRYGNGLFENEKQAILPRKRPAAGQVEDEDEDEDEETLVEFEDDFDASENDPRNDIRHHQQEIGKAPKGPRKPLPVNREELKTALKGALQQKLPLPEPPAEPPVQLEEMEPLAPNPHRVQLPQVIRRSAAELASPWKQPESNLLNSPEDLKQQMQGEDTASLAKTIQDTLRSFRVDAEVRPEDISIGPTVIRFGIRPTGKPMMKEDEKGRLVPIKDSAGNIVYETRTRVSRIMALQNDLALVLESKTIRMEAPVPGRPYVGVEIPNKNSRLVTLREILESKEFQVAKSKSKLTVALGKDVAGAVRVGDLAKMPHLLIAGATGAGKCLAYDEPVFLADGRICNVQELIGTSDYVIGVNDTRTFQQIPVQATFTENGVQEVFEITLDNGLVLRRTGEHPLWAAMLDENQSVGLQKNGRTSRRTRAIKAGWVQTKDLRVCGNRSNFDGHVILSPLSLQQEGTLARGDAEVILCAAFLAEGGLNTAGRSHLSASSLGTPRISNANAPIVALVASAAMMYGCRLVVSHSLTRGNVDYSISRIDGEGRGKSNPIAQLVCDWGMNCLATQKRIPDWVFQLPNKQIALFLRMFVDCDGWITVRGHRSCVSVSLANPILVQQIGQLALRLGIIGTYTQKEHGFAGAWTWSTTMVQAWQEKVGSLIKSEKLSRAIEAQTLAHTKATTTWNAWRRAQPLLDQTFADCPQGYEWRKIVAIRRTVVPTVNIEVHSDNHAFIGYVVEHNSVMINAIISSVIMQASPEDVRMLMVDPKMVELSMYNGIPHLLSPVVIEVEKVVGLLKIAIAEMEKRYRLFSQLGVRNLDGYRKLRAERSLHGDQTLNNLPAIVIIIDELADLMMAAPEEVEGLICRLAQLARATGIHLVVATQRPSVDVITGLIKANIPTRISFMVSSAVDSRTIIDMGGAERLLGRGDMLYLPADAGKPERIQGAFVADEEAEHLVAYWRQQAMEHAAQIAAIEGKLVTPGVEPGWEVSEQSADEFELEDDLLEQAEQVVQEYERASISLLQRRLKIGYSRAARLIDLMEERGIISHAEPGGRAREILEPRALSRHSGGEGRTMADEAADIMEEERQREEFLKKQAERGHQDNSLS
jgi:DNA segregation ATPase FtsK/SpoIIIE-like protein